MGTGRTDEFHQDAVRIALTSGLSRRQVADDRGVGLSTFNKWVNAQGDTDVVSAEDRELARESERLRHESLILKDLPGSGNSPRGLFPPSKRDILKKASRFFARHGGDERHGSG